MNHLYYFLTYLRRGVSVYIYLFKISEGNARSMCKTCSKLTINTSERRQGHLSGVFIANFAQISHSVLLFSLLTLKQ